MSKPEQLDIVFDGPPGPEAGRFVEVETTDGRSVRVGEWRERDDKFWVLRIDLSMSDHFCPKCLEANPEWDQMDGCEDPYCPEQSN